MILVCGDTHGDVDYHKLSNDTLVKQFGRLPDYLIVCGDFGVPWSNDLRNKQDMHMKKWYESKPYQVIVCLGNHENYSRISQMPQEEYLGGKVRRFGKNIVFVEKNQILTIENKTFYFFGGALSIDKLYRVPSISWWPEEDATAADQYAVVETLKNISEVDYIISHTCPESIVGDFTRGFEGCDDHCPTRRVLDYVDTNLHCKVWYFGHFHRDKVVGHHTCLYTIVREVV